MPDAVEWRHWQAINASLQGFADAFDRADLDALLALFAPDAIWDHGPEGERRGHRQIAAFLSERFAGYARTSHHVGPPVVSVAATPSGFGSVAYLIATHVRHDGSGYTGYGRYITQFHYAGSAMLIVRHKVVAHVTQGASAPVNQLMRTDWLGK